MPDGAGTHIPRIWESACGEGYLVRALQREGFSVVATDLHHENPGKRLDFLNGTMSFPYDIQVTNPPFSLKYKWLARSYELGMPFALLMPVETMAAKAAQSLFDKHGVEILMLERRINFKMPNKGWDGTANFPVAWFTWKLNIGRQITWLCPIDQNGEK